MKNLKKPFLPGKVLEDLYLTADPVLFRSVLTGLQYLDRELKNRAYDLFQKYRDWGQCLETGLVGDVESDILRMERLLSKEKPDVNKVVRVMLMAYWGGIVLFGGYYAAFLPRPLKGESWSHYCERQPQLMSFVQACFVGTLRREGWTA